VGWALSYDQSMRYAQRGGYTPAEQQRRERLRLEAAGRFARGDSTGEIAAQLRVTDRTVRRWRQAWRDGGARGAAVPGAGVAGAAEPAAVGAAGGHLVAAQARHGQLRRCRPGRPGPHRQAQAEEDPVPAPHDRRLPGRHRPVARGSITTRPACPATGRAAYQPPENIARTTPAGAGATPDGNGRDAGS